MPQPENAPQPENVAAWLLARNLERCPDKAAYLCGDDTLTHRALAAEAARFANLLRARGIAPGDRVALVLPDSFAYPKAVLGALLLGAVPVPVSAMLTPQDYAFILADCQAQALITWEDSPAAEAARDVPHTGVVLFCGLDGPWGLCDHSAEFAPVAPPPASLVVPPPASLVAPPPASLVAPDGGASAGPWLRSDGRARGSR